MSELPTHPRERRLVFLTAGGPENDAAIRAAVLRAPDWGAVAAIAARERAVPIVWRRIAGCAGDLVPAEVAGRLRGLSMVADFEQRALEERLAQSLDALAAAGIEAMLLKGAGLAGQVYRGFLDRPMIDLDVLVRREEAARARDVLGEAGWSAPRDPALDAFYEVHQHLPPLEDTRGSRRTLELHTGLLSAGHPFRWPVESVWRNAVPVRVAGRDALAPSLAHGLLHLCVHFAWSHQLESGGWRAARDVAAIAASDDLRWDDFVALARQSLAASCCYWTFRMARALAGVSVPEGVETQLRPRLPDAAMRRLESHFALQLATRGLGCPSLRLARFLWEAAIRPRWCGHGSVRPWHHSAEYVPSAPAAAAPAGTASGWGKLAEHARRADGWRAYASGVLLDGAAPPETGAAR